ncbi:sigma-70 family RNA polymerase sigma factor [Methylibium sp.]|uniref:sigma-70 family RNA polymerase sigma factor n=1 Tax=Methylibium sp. TaxID=2067992 RepID=UPI0033406BCB
MSDPTPEPSDDTLMQAFAGGDARAFERLYARHHVALYRFVRRLLGSACAAQTDEVFQDTWLRVIDARTRWAPRGASFRTWLFTLGHHRAIDCLRKSGREVSVDAPGPDPWEPEGEPWTRWPAAQGADAQGVDELAFWRAAGQRLLDCLDGLPAAQKAVFLLHHEDGLSLAELAAALELGFETAKSRLRYAMSKLRTCMGAYLPGAGVGAVTVREGSA